MLIHKERLSGTTASGVVTLTTAKFSGVLLHLIYLKPATDTTTYDLEITDLDNEPIYKELGIQGRLLREVRIPTNGQHKVKITAASADEAFTGYLKVREN